jgi:hypothetical protein
MSETIELANALLELDASGSLVPHGIGGHAREIITRLCAELAKQSDLTMRTMTALNDARAALAAEREKYLKALDRASNAERSVEGLTEQVARLREALVKARAILSKVANGGHEHIPAQELMPAIDAALAETGETNGTD